jgi:hypothetical protein
MTEPLPEQTDNSVRPEDGPQDVSQDPLFQEADTDGPADAADPAVQAER